MREILFRAWDKRYGGWFNSAEVVINGNGEVLFSDNEYCGACGFPKYTLEDAIEINQYTGLLDKNGKEIYEGDIVRVFQPFNVPTKATVELNDGCFELNGIELTWRDYVKCFVVNHAIEIIGNIYENPELLEVEE